MARTLWPGATTARANANLRSSLWWTLRTGHRIIDASAHEMTLLPEWSENEWVLIECRRVLLDELGLEPTDALRNLLAHTSVR